MNLHANNDQLTDAECRVRAALRALPAEDLSVMNRAGYSPMTADLQRIIVPKRPNLIAGVKGRASFQILKITFPPDAHVLGALVPPYVRDNPVPLRGSQLAMTIHLASTSITADSSLLITAIFEFLGTEAVMIERRIDFHQINERLAA